jgi:opacity protein-like surface antigen
MNGRILSVAAAALIALSVPSAANAQFYISGGATFPSGDFGDYAKTGWQIAGGYLFDLGTEGLSVGIDGFYGENKHDVGEETSPGLESDSKTNPYGIMGVVLYEFGLDGSVQPYAFGGLGWLAHKFSGEIFGEDVSETDSGFGWQLGAGVAFPVSQSIALYGEGRYTAGTGDVSETKFFSLLGGVSFGI